MRRAHFHTRGRWQGAGAWCRSAHGFAMITTLLLLVLLTSSVTTAIAVGGLHNRTASNLQHGLQATYLAEAGIQHALYQLRRSAQWRAGITGVTLGRGTYSVSVSQATPAADITLTATGAVAGAERTITLTLRPTLISLAGNGSGGFAGDGGPATAARLGGSAFSFIDAQSNLYVVDQNNQRVRWIRPGADGRLMGASDELITTIAGTGSAGYGGDGGPATAATFKQPSGIAGSTQGDLYIVDQNNDRIRRIRPGADGRVTGASDELITTVAGTGTAGYGGDGGPATAALLKKPSAIWLDFEGNLYIADQNNHRIRWVWPGLDGRITGSFLEFIFTVVGTGSAGYSGDGNRATAAQINSPRGLYVDAQGYLYFADRGNSCVRVVRPGLDGHVTGTVSELIFTVAGICGTSGYSGDGGQATAALLMTPNSVFGDARGYLYIADQGNHRIRMVMPGADGRVLGASDEIITTVVGTGVAGYGGDGGPPSAAVIQDPEGLIVVAGSVYFSDSGNKRIRRTLLRIIRWQGE